MRARVALRVWLARLIARRTRFALLPALPRAARLAARRLRRRWLGSAARFAGLLGLARFTCFACFDPRLRPPFGARFASTLTGLRRLATARTLISRVPSGGGIALLDAAFGARALRIFRLGGLGRRLLR
ncbi:MAG TPA: hypothetical protein VIH96_06820, partial [Paraburkholderia sp.]